MVSKVTPKKIREKGKEITEKVAEVPSKVREKINTAAERTFEWVIERASEGGSLEELVKELITEKVMNIVSAIMGKMPRKGALDKVPGKLHLTEC